MQYLSDQGLSCRISRVPLAEWVCQCPYRRRLGRGIIKGDDNRYTFGGKSGVVDIVRREGRSVREVAEGSAAPTGVRVAIGRRSVARRGGRTPTACCASTSQAPADDSTRSPTNSTAAHAKRSAGIPQPSVSLPSS